MPNDFLLELGAEEIPASFIEPALGDLSKALVAKLAEARLEHGAVRTFGTPRRLAVLISQVHEKAPDVRKEVLGPPVRAAFDASGAPTKAGLKFAEGLGLRVEALRRVSTAKGEYLGADVDEKGRRAQEIIGDALAPLVHALSFKKSMRWGDVEQSFARPLHWIVALLGEEVLPVIFADVRSGRTTWGHRFLSSGPLELRTASDYEPSLKKAHVVADVKERKMLLLERLQNIAKAGGGKVLEDAALVDEVTQLVESPNPVLGTFDARHLDLPPEVLVQEMRGHQRYFSLVDEQGKLLPKFIAVSNTPVKDEKLSLRGYERVLRSRLADGRFFFDEDRKQPLASRVEKLERVVWHQKLGSYAEKVNRIRALAASLAQQTGHEALLKTVDRAALLAKADLVTGMVGEFPELQGVMGREYAIASGEPADVALAISEHYLPRGANDAVPTQPAGALIGLADRLDSLTGIFALGKAPTGQADPFGLRRACVAIINVVLARGLRFSLSKAIDESLALLSSKLGDVPLKPGETKAQVLEFFRGRLKSAWTEEHRADVVEAVLSAGFDDLVAARKRLEALSQWVSKPDFQPLAVAFKRVVNIVEKQGQDVQGGKANPAKFVEEPEKRLHTAYTSTRGKVVGLVQKDDYANALKEITQLKPEVDAFFDKVMVNAEDRDVRENRIRFLTEIGALFSEVADFSKIQADA